MRASKDTAEEAHRAVESAPALPVRLRPEQIGRRGVP